MHTHGQKNDTYFYFTTQIFVATLLVCGALSNTLNICTLRLTCGKCIEASPDCAWCWKDKPDQNFTMCDYKENLIEKGCEKIVDPKSKIHIEKDSPFSSGTATEGAVQIKPQKIRIKLRPNTVKKIYVEFRQAKDYPVDLYYLMDLSNSMRDDKDNLVKLGGQLAHKMGEITRDFHLGFGSFVDKTVAPFVSTHEEKLVSPCGNCSAPYGFHNNMKLSVKTGEFAKKVEEAKISGNLDAPEGGFDAIMQAVVCEKEIGWRNDSRKLLVYSSDNSFHFAGDGKLGGLVEPNDERCHLDEKGFYTMSTVLDYPSLSQINRQIKKNKVTIIFAVTNEQKPLYEQLTKGPRMLKGSRLAILDRNSSNVVDLIQEQYELITSEVEMTDNLNDKNIKLTYRSKCLETELKETKSCEGLKTKTNVTFEIDIDFSLCPTNSSEWNKTFQIFPVGLQEPLTVELEMLCQCDCEKAEYKETNSEKCSDRNGTFECGICSCNEKRAGKLCECDASQTPEDKNEACYKDNKLCSGAGKCRCGICQCFSGYEGKYCECNNGGCDKKEGKICSGTDHGKCSCGKCICLHGWTGDDCSCRDSKEACMNENGEICSGRGECHCGSCFCNNGEEFFGALCDDCATCPGKCSELNECVECRFKNQHGGNLNCTSCDGVTVNYTDKIEVGDKEKLCAFEDDEKCRYAFKYALDENYMLSVVIKSSKDCPVPLPVVAIVSGVSGGVVATGLFLLMLWKILTTIHDRRELAKFEKERLNAKWNQDDNPIYVGATSTFQNPAYRGD